MDDDLDALALGDLCRESANVRELEPRVNMQQWEGRWSRVERLAGQVRKRVRVLPDRVEQLRTIRLGPRLTDHPYSLILD